MQAYKNQAFENQSFVIEEVYFENCALRNCDLFYSGGDFEWVNASFDNCRFHFRGPAKNTQALFQSMGLLKQPLPGGNIPLSSSKAVN